ncbi:GNAT family N-acetyltransferase [Citricoccus sp. NPDC055426]|uniref:GNAT family N-acetyltransferase n=1 Tax=Citricoccus sp. NPDC055426 TaxID=3155536 RepID=UPI003434CC89
MLHVITPSPERFSALAPDPEEDLERLRRNLVRGTVRPEHLIVAATGDGADLGRVGLYTHPDGVTVAYAQRLASGGTDLAGTDLAGIDLAEIYGVLLDGIASSARSTALARVEVTVVDADEPDPEVKRAVLAARGWQIDGDRLELQAETGATTDARGDGRDRIVEIDPFDPRVVQVMAAAMADSLDHHDRTQVARLGPEAAAAAHRDMMTEGPASVPWLAHRGSAPGPGADEIDSIVGIAAIQAYPTDWSLGYLAVDPRARRAGIGTALARSMLAATGASGVRLATSSVDTANPRIRGTLGKAGFTVRSAHTDFVLHLEG